MMRPIRVILAAAILFAAACSSGGSKQEENPISDTVKIEPSAASLWARLQEDRYRDNWKLWPGKGTFYPGEAPHGDLLTTYLNDYAFNAIKDHAQSLPPGAILLTENYTQGKVLTDITVMYKAPGYNPSGNDWFWLKRDADGTVEDQGQVASCQMCHRAGMDFILTGTPDP